MSGDCSKALKEFSNKAETIITLQAWYAKQLDAFHFEAASSCCTQLAAIISSASARWFLNLEVLNLFSCPIDYKAASHLMTSFYSAGLEEKGGL